MKQRKIPQNIKLQLLRDLIELQLKGYSFKEMSLSIQERLSEYSSNPKEQANRFVIDAQKLLTKENSVDIILTIDNHTIIYEEIYKWFSEYGDIAGANRALASKEKVLGLHKWDDQLVINNRIETNQSTVSYDAEKLSIRERDRLQFLLNKMKYA